MQQYTVQSDEVQARNSRLRFPIRKSVVSSPVLHPAASESCEQLFCKRGHTSAARATRIAKRTSRAFAKALTQGKEALGLDCRLVADLGRILGVHSSSHNAVDRFNSLDPDNVEVMRAERPGRNMAQVHALLDAAGFDLGFEAACRGEVARQSGLHCLGEMASESNIDDQTRAEIYREISRGVCSLERHAVHDFVRVVAVEVLRLTRPDGNILAEIGSWISGKVKPKCQLPGMKRTASEDPFQVILTKLEVDFQWVSGRDVSLAGTSQNVFIKESAEFQMPTKYIQTVHHAALCLETDWRLAHDDHDLHRADPSQPELKDIARQTTAHRLHQLPKTITKEDCAAIGNGDWLEKARSSLKNLKPRDPPLVSPRRKRKPRQDQSSNHGTASERLLAFPLTADDPEVPLDTVYCVAHGDGNGKIYCWLPEEQYDFLRSAEGKPDLNRWVSALKVKLDVVFHIPNVKSWQRKKSEEEILVEEAARARALFPVHRHSRESGKTNHATLAEERAEETLTFAQKVSLAPLR